MHGAAPGGAVKMHVISLTRMTSGVSISMHPSVILDFALQKIIERQNQGLPG